MNEQTELEIKEKLAREEFRLRSLAEEKSKEIAEEIKAVLRKHGASLAEWNHNLYIVPPGFQVYSVWNFPYGVHLDLADVGLTCQRYDCKSHIQHKAIIASGDDIRYYIVDYLADRFHRSTEVIGLKSHLSEFPITPGELANVLAHAFAVTFPEAKYSKWKTLEQAINATHSAQYFR